MRKNKIGGNGNRRKSFSGKHAEKFHGEDHVLIFPKFHCVLVKLIPLK